LGRPAVRCCPSPKVWLKVLCWGFGLMREAPNAIAASNVADVQNVAFVQVQLEGARRKIKRKLYSLGSLVYNKSLTT